MSGRPKHPCPNCATPTVGRLCRACVKLATPPRVPCSPDMAEAIVRILLVDPGVGSVHPHGFGTNGHRKRRVS